MKVLLENIRYNVRHRKAVLAVEREVLGHNRWLTYLHDVDKLIMICLFIPNEWISNFHRFYSWHHCENKIGWLVLDELIFDWAASRRTKPDKPLNVLQTAQKLYPYMYVMLYNRLIELKCNIDL